VETPRITEDKWLLFIFPSRQINVGNLIRKMYSKVIYAVNKPRTILQFKKANEVFSGQVTAEEGGCILY
jgi:hypothetical protein